MRGHHGYEHSRGCDSAGQKGPHTHAHSLVSAQLPTRHSVEGRAPRWYFRKTLLSGPAQLSSYHRRNSRSHTKRLVSQGCSRKDKKRQALIPRCSGFFSYPIDRALYNSLRLKTPDLPHQKKKKRLKFRFF